MRAISAQDQRWAVFVGAMKKLLLRRTYLFVHVTTRKVRR